MTFQNLQESHAHSLDILNQLYEYDDFMESISTLVDLGCGAGLDLEWWATRTTRDERSIPLNIRCVGVDQTESLPLAKKYPNITFQRGSFETTDWIPRKTRFDVLWAHDSFQYVTKPFDTLKIWHNASNQDAMLIITVPETVTINRRSISYIQPSGCYYHHSIVSLIHMLAVTGWDCAAGFFRKRVGSPWIDLAVYKNNIGPLDISLTTWYDLAEKNLIPKSAQDSVNRYGYVRQEDLVLPWLDKSLTWFGK